MNAREVELREVRWQDLAALAEVERRCFPADPWTEATFWAELAMRPRRQYVLALARHPGQGATGPGRDDIVGYAGLDVAGDVADVMTVAVDPGRRGIGVGRMLLEELLRRAEVAGADSVLLEVRADNEAARALYAGYGFTQLRVRPGYYRGVDDHRPVDALVLRREVPAR